MGSVWG